MPTASESVLTSGRFLSNLTDMRDGVAINFTTPSVSVGAAGINVGQYAVLDVFIPAYTNRSPGSGVGAFTRPYLTIVLQGAPGDPTVEANWRDMLWLKQIRPLVPSGSTGAGTSANPIYSNRFRVAFQSLDYSQVRLSGTYIGSFPDCSQFYAALRPGIRRSHELGVVL